MGWQWQQQVPANFNLIIADPISGVPELSTFRVNQVIVGQHIKWIIQDESDNHFDSFIHIF